MDVRFYATLRQIVGAKTVPFELAATATVKDLLVQASAQFPDLAQYIWLPDGGVSDYIKVFVDGREMRHLQLLDTPLPAGVEIDIFPPAAGG